MHYLIFLHIAFSLHNKFYTVFGLIFGRSKQITTYATPWSKVYLQNLVVE